MNKYGIIGLGIILIFLAFLIFQSEDSSFVAKRVAHAGGGIGNRTYTNSIDALNESVKKGFVYFEIDLIFASDNSLVCMHDWKSNFKGLFGYEIQEIPNLSQFTQIVSESKFDVCTLDSLIIWMNQNPDAYIITDAKGDNTKTLEVISKKVPKYEKRVIPQVYYPAEYQKAKELGYKQVIWTLYRYNGTNDEVLEEIKRFKGPFAITMPKERARSSLPTELSKRNIPTYVHTVNSLGEKEEFLKIYNLTEVYTDFLEPE